MFRVAILSVALSLAAGSNATLLCEAWCALPAATNECHDERAPSDSPSLVSGHHCGEGAPDGTTFLKEDVRRGGSFSNADLAIAVARDQFTPPRTGARLDREPPNLQSLQRRLLKTALRI